MPDMFRQYISRIFCFIIVVADTICIKFKYGINFNLQNGNVQRTQFALINKTQLAKINSVQGQIFKITEMIQFASRHKFA